MVSQIDISKSVPTAFIKGGPNIVQATKPIRMSLKNNINSFVFLPRFENLFLIMGGIKFLCVN